MNYPKLITDDKQTVIFNGHEWVNSVKGFKTELSDKSAKIIISGQINSDIPVTIVLSATKKYSSVIVEMKKGSQAKVNLFFAVKNQLEISLDLTVKENSSLELNEYYYGQIKTQTKMAKRITIQAQSALTLNSGYFTKGQFLVNESVNLTGNNASYQGDSLVIGHDSDDIQITQNVFHKAKQTSSNIQNAIVANDSSRIKFDIYGTIDKTMEKSKCFQHSKGILLGEKSWIQVDPKLIINEFDVEAGHGAAIGQINQDEVYYLLSRGLSETQSKRLIIQGYTDPFVARYTLPNQAKFVHKAILNKMGGF